MSTIFNTAYAQNGNSYYQPQMLQDNYFAQNNNALQINGPTFQNQQNNYNSGLYGNNIQFNPYSSYGYPHQYPAYAPPAPSYNDFRDFSFGDTGSQNQLENYSHNGFNVYNFNLNLLRDNIFKLGQKLSGSGSTDPTNTTDNGGSNSGSGGTQDFKSRIKDGEEFKIQFNLKDDGKNTGTNDPLGLLDASGQYTLRYSGGFLNIKGYNESSQTNRNWKTTENNIDNGQIQIGRGDSFTLVQSGSNVIVKQGSKQVGTLVFTNDQ